ncbi:MAG: hypothetical protein U0230_10540 [Polyangiales bacterium]
MGRPRSTARPKGTWEPALRDAPLEAQRLESVDADRWYRVVPIALADEEALPPLHEGVGVPFPLPESTTFRVDRKLVGRGDVRAYRGDVILVSERFARALRASAIPGCRVAEVPHGTPLDVHGRRLHRLFLDLPPFVLDRRTETWTRPSPRKPPSARAPAVTVQGLEAFPVSPATFVHPPDTSCPIGFTQWFGVGPGPSAFRGLLVHGAWLRAFGAVLSEPSELVLEPVEVVGGRALPAFPLQGPLEEPRADEAPSRSLDVLVARVGEGAARYAHELPGPTALEAARRALREAASRAVARAPDVLEPLFASLSGASMFGGALRIFPIAAAPGAAALPSARYGYADTLVEANDEQRCREWGITRPPGFLVFGTRIGDPPSLWALSDRGMVHLLSSSGAILGAGVPPTEWLGDQLADLEYAWSNREAVPFTVGDWIGYDEALRPQGGR